MKLLLLSLLVVAAVGSFINNDIEDQKPSSGAPAEQRRNRTRNIDRELRRSFGVDPAKRRARLQKLRGNARRHLGKMNSTQLAELRELKKQIPNVTIDHSPKEMEDDLFKLNEMEGVSDYMYEGDINLDEAQLREIENENAEETNGTRAKRQVSTTAKRWTNKIVYYEIDTGVNARKRASITAALRYIQDNTCLKFRVSTTAANRISVISGSGCYSNVGMVGGVQKLSIGDGCEGIGIVAHEFAHALGVWHTQMRYDRDNFVSLDMAVIPPAKLGNFDKKTSANTINYTPYEYGSFMHYQATAFSNDPNNPSIVSKDPAYIFTMGSRIISFNDMQMIREAYQCSAACSNTIWCKHGGVQNPANCNTCTCPLGYGGTNCSVRTPGCGHVVTATSTFQTLVITVGDNSTNVRDDFTRCVHWIAAPGGKTIQYRITKMYNPQCNYGCVFNGIEFKTRITLRMTNPRICCPAFNNQLYTSSNNPTPIITYNRYYYSTFTVEYRFI